ncbi:MAG: hypothetical protein MUF20_06855 [Methylotetracoccus sp.]|jgi:hypothetical protein|nr:hypothetical protein [Methylotetracoccus sp.]
MKKAVILGLACVVCGAAFASTEHYVRRDGAHVQHLKITRIGDDIKAAMDVDFEPNAMEAERGVRPCAAEIEGEAKMISETELVFKEQIPGERRYCELRVQLNGDEARVSESRECGYFLANFCRFDSEGKVLLRFK